MKVSVDFFDIILYKWNTSFLIWIRKGARGMKFLNVLLKDSWTKKLDQVLDTLFPRPQPKLAPVRVPARRSRKR